MKKKTSLLGALWLMLLVAIVASGFILIQSAGKILQRYSRLEEVRQTLMEEYYMEVDEETLINGAIEGMLSAADDPYTFYYTPDEMAEHNQEMGAGYCGVGLLVQNNANGAIEILRVYKGSPADNAGIQAGDLIVEINGCAVSGESVQSMNEAMDLLCGENGTSVQMDVVRDEKTLHFQMVLDTVEIDNVTWRMLEGNVGYINIFQFSGNAVDGFETALAELQAKGAQSLIVDVRNNPGGLLNDVVAIADDLLGEGLIVYTQDRQERRQDYYSDAEQCDLPLAVLVNENSASASEILATAVQDHQRGAVIGQKTYGKGIVQTLITFQSDGAGMQYTSACYYTPSGRNIHGEGVIPDIQVENQEGYYSYSGIPDIQNDVQLQTAIRYLCGE